jgi:hypothetical protein
MTRPRDIDSVLEAWFLDGPSEMPDRLFEAVFDRVERVPQRRLALLKLRFAEMSSTARWIAAGAAAIVVVGFGLFAFGRAPDSSNVAASPPPSASPSASAAAAPVPTELRHSFTGELRQGTASQGQDRSIITFTENHFAYNNNILSSTASAPHAGRFVLVAENVAGGCAVGDQGTYSWTLSPRASKMTVTLEDDACAARAAVLPGEWQRSNCPQTGDLCLGDLEAGHYSSQYIDPFVPAGGPWKARFGALTYDVPAGWSNSEDYPNEYRLARQDAPTDAGIIVWQDIVIVSEVDPCSETAAPNVGRTAQAMTDWLASAPGVKASSPVPVTIGGLSGWRLDVAMDPAWTATCTYSQGKAARGLFTDSLPSGGLQWGLGPETYMRLFILDLGDGRALIADIEGPTKADYDAFVDEATAIVESFNFPR